MYRYTVALICLATCLVKCGAEHIIESTPKEEDFTNGIVGILKRRGRRTTLCTCGEQEGHNGPVTHRNECTYQRGKQAELGYCGRTNGVCSMVLNRDNENDDVIHIRFGCLNLNIGRKTDIEMRLLCSTPYDKSNQTRQLCCNDVDFCNGMINRTLRSLPSVLGSSAITQPTPVDKTDHQSASPENDVNVNVNVKIDVNELGDRKRPIAHQTTCTSRDSRIFKHGEMDGGCRECKCGDRGQSQCSTLIERSSCPSLNCIVRVQKKRKGKCCSDCIACVDCWSKQISNIGDFYKSVHDPCKDKCECRLETDSRGALDAVADCGPPRSTYMPATCLDQTKPIKLPLQCHPRCPDHNGHIGGAPIPVYPPGMGYSIYCRVITCAQICVRGYIVRTDEYGCPSCQCERTNDVDGPKMCDDQQVSRCDKKCVYGFQLTEYGGCYKCQCSLCPVHVSSNKREFMLTTNCFKMCPYGSESNDDNCPICKCLGKGEQRLPLLLHMSYRDRNCVHNGVVRMVGDQWLWEHKNCRRCLCKTGGRVFCSAVHCPVLNCTRAQQQKSHDSCCKRCAGQREYPVAQPVPCSSRHLQMAEGESFKLDGCIVCTCHIGQVLCELKPCKVLTCSNPVYDAESCCNVCPPKPVIEARQHLTCFDSGHLIPLHGTFEIDNCLIMQCLYNERCTHNCSNCARCTIMRHHHNVMGAVCGGDCQNPVWLAQRCCKVCLPDNGGFCEDGAYSNGYDHQYANGEEWHSGRGVSYICRNGTKSLSWRRPRLDYRAYYN